VAVKGGAFAYSLDRPFAPDVRNLGKLPAAKERIGRGMGSKADRIVVADALAVITSQAAGLVGLPMQIHVGLIWSASGPARIPEIMELAPLFEACRETTFVIFHGAYPRTDDLAHVAATVTNVRAELNWVPFWSGLDFPHMIGKWIDMIPNDRILYGTDGGGFSAVAHDMVTREALAEALDKRVRQGYLSSRIALEIAANILRNNSVETYGLGLPPYHA
jgi:predicted TIM-barrel fold metal-dependent hydrolase